MCNLGESLLLEIEVLVELLLVKMKVLLQRSCSLGAKSSAQPSVEPLYKYFQSVAITLRLLHKTIP